MQRRLLTGHTDMRNLNADDEDDNYDYKPNELANLAYWNRRKYEEIVKSNLEDGDTVRAWEQRNLERMQKYLRS